MKVEYLIVTNENEPDGFCCNRETFINLLHTDGRIKISEDELIWTNREEKLTIKILIETETIKDKNQRYFLIELINDDEEKIDEFTQLNKALKKIINKLGIERYSLNTLWNDISNTYSNKSYSLINELENLMRKLISKFMLINIGKDWVSENIPDEVKTKISQNEARNELLDDVLHNADFIDLSNFLFKKYRKKDIGELDNYLSATKDTKVTIQELKNDYLSQSNWDKYFSAIVKTKGDKLKNDWDLLYKIRNKVAHNKLVEKGDFERIQSYSRSIGEKLHEAINKLSEIKLSPEEKVEVISNLQSPLEKVERVVHIVLEWYFKHTIGIAYVFNDRTVDFQVQIINGGCLVGVVKYCGENLIEKFIENNISRNSLISTYFLVENEEPLVNEIHYILIFSKQLSEKELILLANKRKAFENHKSETPKMSLVCGYLNHGIVVFIDGYNPQITCKESK